MQPSKTARIAFATLALATAGLGALSLERQQSNRAGAQVPQPGARESRAAEVSLIQAQAFTLEVPYEHEWCAERPMVQAGWLLVLEVPADLVQPRAMATPVLYAGDQVLERVNYGWPDGLVVAIAPGAIDLATAPLWFGAPALPEQLDSAAIASELQLARDAGVAAQPVRDLDAALTRGGLALSLKDRDELRRQAAALVLLYASSEHELVEGITAPPPERALIR